MPGLPDFFLFGVPKAGTTSVHRYLGEHPEVFVSPVKEPNFFSSEGGPPSHPKAITDFDAYRALFDGAEGRRAVGEGSVGYLYYRHAAAGILRRVPGARFVAVLRQPVERAYSHWLMEFNGGKEPVADFAEAARKPIIRHRDYGDTHPVLSMKYLAGGLYAFHLSHYLRLFPRERFHLVLHEDLKADPLGTMRGIYAFLGVDPAFAPDTARRFNETVSAAPKRGAAGRLLSPPRAVKDALRPLLPEALRRRLSRGIRRVAMQPSRLPPEVRAALTPLFHEDIAALEGLLSRDLSAWRA